MWLVTDEGFYSCAVDKDDSTRIMVRARIRTDLEALRKHIPDLRIRSTPNADYPYRAFVPREVWRDTVAALAESMDYSSFTGSIERKLGRRRRTIHKRAWAELAALDERGPEPLGLSETEVRKLLRPHTGLVSTLAREGS